MSDLRSRLPGQSVIQRTLELHPDPTEAPSGDALSWYKGALGEIAVAGILAELGPRWTVLHSVPVGRGDSDIDHVVIGPPGAFTINTKSHPGQEVWMAGHGLLVSGRRTNYIGIAAAEAFRAEALLSSAAGLTVPVVPMVVLVDPGKRTIRGVAEGGVRVLADWELLAELQLSPREFSDEQVERIVAAAIQPKTWRDEPLPEVDTENLALRFNAMVARSAQLGVFDGDRSGDSFAVGRLAAHVRSASRTPDGIAACSSSTPAAGPHCRDEARPAPSQEQVSQCLCAAHRGGHHVVGVLRRHPARGAGLARPLMQVVVVPSISSGTVL